MAKKFHRQTIDFRGIAQVSIGAFKSRQVLDVRFQATTPTQRGHLIEGMKNLRDCPMVCLVGEVHFSPPPPEQDRIEIRLEKLLCWHGNRNAREAAAEMLGLEVSDVAGSLLAVGQISAAYRDTLLSLALDRADQIFRDIEWPEDAKQEAIDLRHTMALIKAAFVVQQSAAWAWRMHHCPFDDALGEANYIGAATFGGVMAGFDQNFARFKQTHDLYKAGREKVGRALRYLDQMGMGYLRQIPKAQIVSVVGEERVKHLAEDLEHCARQADEIRAILNEIERLGATNSDPMKGRKRQLDQLLVGVPAVYVLAMRCAAFAEMITLNVFDDDWRRPPEWLTLSRSNSATAASRRLFYQIFLFYRGVFVQDCQRYTLHIPANDCRSQSRIDVLADLYDPKKDQNREVVRAMRQRVKGGTFGSGPELPGITAEYGRKFGWRMAS